MAGAYGSMRMAALFRRLFYRSHQPAIDGKSAAFDRWRPSTLQFIRNR